MFCVLHRLPRGLLRNRKKKTERAPQARVHIAEIVTKKINKQKYGKKKHENESGMLAVTTNEMSCGYNASQPQTLIRILLNYNFSPEHTNSSESRTIVDENIHKKMLHI